MTLMFFENDLEFLRDILKKNHLQTHIVSSSDLLSSVTDVSGAVAYGEDAEALTVEGFTGKLAEKTLYRLSGAYGLYHFCLILPGTDSSVLFIGPYLTSQMSREQMLEIGESNGISPKNIKYLTEYYFSLPVLSEEGMLLSVINTFCERIWKSPSFAVVDLDKKNFSSLLPSSVLSVGERFDDTQVGMKMMEMRYAFENEIMQAVTLGQIHKESQLMLAFSEPLFEKRLPDPIRNAKNYGIIMNTLLRKAAEKGGVHPMYLDSMSSSFAKKIEQMASLSESRELMCEMFRSYCRLVRKHSMKDYSPAVQKTILIIDSELSSDLTLTSLAARQNISAGYLSAVFKKETGKTLSEYIREKRIESAIHLLQTTHLQIQTVALHCGIMDVQYFSKMFKKQTGKTPKEYRESIKDLAKA